MLCIKNRHRYISIISNQKVSYYILLISLLKYSEIQKYGLEFFLEKLFKNIENYILTWYTISKFIYFFIWKLVFPYTFYEILLNFYLFELGLNAKRFSSKIMVNTNELLDIARSVKPSMLGVNNFHKLNNLQFSSRSSNFSSSKPLYEGKFRIRY